MSFKLSATNSITTYVWYIAACKMMKNHKCVVSLFVNLGRDGSLAKTLDSTNVDDAGLHIYSESRILLSIWAAYLFVKHGHNSSFFHVNAFHRHVETHCDELHVLHLNWGNKTSQPPSCLFIQKHQHSKTISHFTHIQLWLWLSI